MDVKRPYYCLPELNEVKRARRSRLLPRRGERQRRRPAWGPGSGNAPQRAALPCLSARSFVRSFIQPTGPPGSPPPSIHRAPSVPESLLCSGNALMSWKVRPLLPRSTRARAEARNQGASTEGSGSAECWEGRQVGRVGRGPGGDRERSGGVIQGGLSSLLSVRVGPGGIGSGVNWSSPFTESADGSLCLFSELTLVFRELDSLVEEAYLWG